MGRGGQWTSFHSKHVAEALLAATEDPIAGIDRKADAFKQKLWEEFVSKDPSPTSARKYRDRTVSAIFLQSKAISKDIMVFQKSLLFVKACKPAGNLTDEELMSLAVARHTGIMQGPGLDYSFKDTPHYDWVLSDAFKVLKRAPKWQGNDGPVMDLAGGSSVSSTDAAAASPVTKRLWCRWAGRKQSACVLKTGMYLSRPAQAAIGAFIPTPKI